MIYEHKRRSHFHSTSEPLFLCLGNVLVVEDILSLGSVEVCSLCVVAEFLVAKSDLFEHDLVGFANRLDLEETVHGFERDTLGLGYEEPDEDDTEKHHAGEEEVDTTTGGTHVEEHQGSEARNDEVPQPIVCSGL
jgi:hypothetical protein